MEMREKDRSTSADKPGAAKALVLATVAFTLCFSVWGSISPLAPLFAQMLSLSATETGLLVAVPVLLGSLARIPVGLLTDRYGGRRVFTGLLALLLLPAALIGTASSYPLLLFWGLWLGLAGASFAVGIPFVVRWFPPDNQGLALGIYGVGNIGTALTGFVVPWTAARYGWESAFWLFLPLLALMAALFWTIGRDAPGPAAFPLSIASRLALFRTEPLTWILSIFYFVTAGGFVAFSIYIPTFLVEAYGLELADAAARSAGFVVLATLARPVGGFIADRIGGERTLSGIFFSVALLAIVLAFLPGMVLLTASFLALAAALGIGNGAVFKLVADRFPEAAGTVGGLVGAVGTLGAFFPPILMGVVRDLAGGYALGFLLLSAFALFNLALDLLLLRRCTPQLAR